MCGTPLLMAPEIIFNKPYGIKVDIWSLGMLFYQMLFGKLPITAYTTVELEIKIKSLSKDIFAYNNI